MTWSAKWRTLEKTVDVSGWVERLTVSNPERDRVVARAKQLMDTELLAMGDDITRHPEIGFQEKRSVAILTDYLKQHGFEVTMGVAGLDTAFVARYKGNHGAPNLGVILEYDALRGTKRPFHGDQHSTQGPIGMAAAVAMAEYLERTHAAGQRHRVRHARRRNDAARGQDRHVQSRRVRRHGRDRAQPFDERHHPRRPPDSAPAA